MVFAVTEIKAEFGFN